MRAGAVESRMDQGVEAGRDHHGASRAADGTDEGGMTMRGFCSKSGLARVVAIGSFLLAARTSPAQFISDPYDPWNAQYRAFIFPLAPINTGIGNQARSNVFSGVAPSHPYAPFNPEDPFGRNSGTGRFMPYYQSYRGLDETFGRTYRANANDTFFEKQDERQKLYFEALRETDPRKRAELLKQLDDAKLKSVRESSAARKRGPSSSRTANAKAATSRLPGLDNAARGADANANTNGDTNTNTKPKPDSNLLDAPTPNDLLRAPTPIGRSSSAAGIRRSRTADRQLERKRTQAADAAKAATAVPPRP